MDSLDQMLSYAGSKIADMSEEFEKHQDALPREDFKTMAKELRKTKERLVQVLKSNDFPKYDHKLLSTILLYINKIKKNKPKEIEIKNRSHKVVFLDELNELQGILKIIKKKQSPASSKIKSRVVVKIERIKSKGSAISDKDIDQHLNITKSKLNLLKKNFSKGEEKVKTSHYKELNIILKKANISLVKAQAIHKSLKGQYKPNYDRKVMRKILDEIYFFQNHIEEQVRLGTAQAQVNLFWHTLKEFKALLQDLEGLKKTRGKTVASVLTDMSS
jgi:hypothetical protein